MPTCIPATCSSTHDGKLVAVDFGIMGRLGAEGAALPRRNPATASSPATISAPPRCISRPAMCRAHHSVESFAQAIRAIGEPIHNRTAEDISMAKLLMLLFEVTGLFDMRTRPELLLLQKTMVVVEGVGALARSQARHVDGRRAGGARMDRAPSRAGRPARRRGRRRRRGRPLPRRRAGAARARRRRWPSSSTPSPATASCSRRRPSRPSAAPRRGATAGPRRRCGRSRRCWRWLLCAAGMS